jgi:GNAT superfamily N-acetyltransferase
MQLTRRKYQSEADGLRIREFLREVFLCNERRELSWPLYRWDYWRWHINENIYRFELSAAIFLWEARDGCLAAVLNPDCPGEAFLQVHPGHRSAELDVAMISTAETQYATTLPGGRQRLVLWLPAQDSLRQDILRRRGYVRQDGAEYQRRRDLSRPVPDVPLPEGYALRPLDGVDELSARSWLSWVVFHPSEPDDRYEGWEWYRNVQRAPLYRPDLDLVAVAPDGELAAFATLWYDEQTRTAAFEPVGTHPNHRQLGLGKALLTEGLRCARTLGATLATVNSYSVSAGALYESVGFTEYDLSEPWVKEW